MMIDEITSPVGSTVVVTGTVFHGYVGFVTHHHPDLGEAVVSFGGLGTVRYAYHELSPGGPTLAGVSLTPAPVAPMRPVQIKCEYGASKCGSTIHSPWCPLDLGIVSRGV